MDRPFLIGKKIYMRPLELDDVTPEYLDWINDGRVLLGRIERHFPITRDKQVQYVTSVLAREDHAFFAIVDKALDKFIGTAKMGPINWVHRFTEHAIMIGDRASWNKGFGGEVILLLLEYGFRHLNMHKIYAGVSSANPASLRKNERVGYKVEAVFKEKLFSNGRYVDQAIMSMSSEEFFRLHPEPVLQSE
jgi:ribosomal-protein-alanine N-acetyltransferase